MRKLASAPIGVRRDRQSACMFCEESLGKISAKDVGLSQNGSVQEFYGLKALVTLDQVNTSVVEKQ